MLPKTGYDEATTLRGWTCDSTSSGSGSAQVNTRSTPTRWPMRCCAAGWSPTPPRSDGARRRRLAPGSAATVLEPGQRGAVGVGERQLAVSIEHPPDPGERSQLGAQLRVGGQLCPARPAAGRRRARSPRRRSRRTPPGRHRGGRRRRRRLPHAGARPASAAASRRCGGRDGARRWRSRPRRRSSPWRRARCSARAAANRGSGAAKRRCSRSATSGGSARRAGAGAAVQQGQARAGAAERAGDRDQVPRSRAVAADQRAGIVRPADDGDGHRQRLRARHVAARDRRAVAAADLMGAARRARARLGARVAGRQSAMYASPGSHAIAARSDSAEAIARHPISSGRSWSERKWTPSTSVSIEVTA